MRSGNHFTSSNLTSIHDNVWIQRNIETLFIPGIFLSKCHFQTGSITVAEPSMVERTCSSSKFSVLVNNTQINIISNRPRYNWQNWHNQYRFAYTTVTTSVICLTFQLCHVVWIKISQTKSVSRFEMVSDYFPSLIEGVSTYLFCESRSCGSASSQKVQRNQWSIIFFHVQNVCFSYSGTWIPIWLA